MTSDCCSRYNPCMPITLPPISRRRFLAGSVAAAAALAASRFSLGLEPPKVDPDRFVLISDSHIDADATKVEKDANMTDQLRTVAAAIIANWIRPAAVLHGGDLAHSSGQA